MTFYSYRISPYNNENSSYQAPFSYSNFNQQNIAEYLLIEQKVLTLIFNTLEYCNISKMHLVDLEIYNKFKKRKVKELSLVKIIKLILREKIWCKLKTDKLEIHFGYDYYVYILCQYDISTLLRQNSNGLIIQEVESPY